MILLILINIKTNPLFCIFGQPGVLIVKKIQPSLVALQKKYQAQGIALISISFNEDEGALPQDEIKRRGYAFITAVMGEKVATLYGVRGTPTTFFINRKNEIIWKTSSSDKTDPRFELVLKEIIKK